MTTGAKSNIVKLLICQNCPCDISLRRTQRGLRHERTVLFTEGGFHHLRHSHHRQRRDEQQRLWGLVAVHDVHPCRAIVIGDEEDALRCIGGSDSR